jgi:tetratricopeptide (TPR) repeat protein
MWTDAERSFSESLALDREHAPAHAGLAAVRLRQRREQEAADHALEAIALRFEQPAAHLELGRAMARLGRYDRAAIALEAALLLAPDSPRVRRYLSRVKACRSVAEIVG